MWTILSQITTFLPRLHVTTTTYDDDDDDDDDDEYI